MEKSDQDINAETIDRWCQGGYQIEIIRAGFQLTHVFENTTGEGNLHDHNIPLLLGHPLRKTQGINKTRRCQIGSAITHSRQTSMATSIPPDSA